MTSEDTESSIERLGLTPIDAARTARRAEMYAGPESEHVDELPWELAGPIDWHALDAAATALTFHDLAAFLIWAVPRWDFTTDQFPHACWWQHHDVVEEMTAWWGMWLAYVHNPDAHPADPVAFHERTWNLKQRLAASYRGRCRHGHQATEGAPVPLAPPT